MFIANTLENNGYFFGNMHILIAYSEHVLNDHIAYIKEEVSNSATLVFGHQFVTSLLSY